MDKYRKIGVNGIKKTFICGAFLFSYEKIVYDEAVCKRSRK